MWFIARKTLDNSCACRCYITFGWESKWLRSDGKKEQKLRKTNEWKTTKRYTESWCTSPKRKKSFFSYLFNDTKIYCIPLFIATQTMPSYRLFSFRSNIAQFIISRVWLLSCHMRRERYRCIGSSSFSSFTSFTYTHFNGPGPSNSSSFRYITWKKRAQQQCESAMSIRTLLSNYIVIFANKLHKRDAIFNEEREKWNESIED